MLSPSEYHLRTLFFRRVAGDPAHLVDVVLAHPLEVGEVVGPDRLAVAAERHRQRVAVVLLPLGVDVDDPLSGELLENRRLILIGRLGLEHLLNGGDARVDHSQEHRQADGGLRRLQYPLHR
jgi:hypothetical protein